MRFIQITTIICILIISGVFAWNNLFLEEKVISKESFHSFHVAGDATVFLIPSKEQKVVLKGDENTLENAIIGIDKQELTICSESCDFSSRKFEVYVYTDTIKNIYAGGASSIITHGMFVGNQLNIKTDGAAELKMRLQLDSLQLTMDGAANVQLAGSTNVFDFQIGKVGDLMAYNFESQFCSARLENFPQNPGIARINVTQTLSATINGPRQLLVKGDAKIIEENIAGEGEIIKYQ